MTISKLHSVATNKSNDEKAELQKLVLSVPGITDYAVFLFGSRAEGSAKERSDFDVGIFGRQRINSFVLANLEEYIEESNFPYRVDIIDFLTCSEAFKKEALKKIELWNLPKDMETILPSFAEPS